MNGLRIIYLKGLRNGCVDFRGAISREDLSKVRPRCLLGNAESTMPQAVKSEPDSHRKVLLLSSTSLHSAIMSNCSIGM